MIQWSKNQGSKIQGVKDCLRVKESLLLLDIYVHHWVAKVYALYCALDHYSFNFNV